MDEINRLYFIVGFLLGILLMGSLSVAAALVYNEYVKPNKDED
jgi:hypothetical protein